MRRTSAGIGIVALIAGAVGFTAVQLASTSSTAATTPGIVTGAGAGGGPDVHGYSGTGSPTGPNFFAYDGGFFGGVRVASGDVNGDGIDEIITGAGPGGGPHVKVFDGATNTTLSSAFAFDGSFTGGVFVAAGDVNGDGKSDVIVGAGPGSVPSVKVFSGAGGGVLYDFLAFNAGYTGGVSVAAGDVNGDGKADIIAGSATSDSVISVYSGADRSLLKNYATYSGWQGGIFVGAADINGDGKADIVTGAGPGGGPHVKVFNANGDGLIASFFAYDAGFHGGVRVAGTDANGDGTDDIITGPGPGGGPHVKVFDGKGGPLIASFFAYNPAFAGGVYVTGHTIVASGSPKVNSTTPSTLGAGATAKDVTINGAGFVSGTTVAFSGTGITVNGAPTFVDQAHIKVNVTIAGNATPGARDVTVTRPDAETASCTGCFSVGIAPTVSSINPASGAQGSSLANVNINGTGFVNGAAASFSGTGITVNSTVFNSPTQVTANITIASSAPVGTRDVIITNPDSGTGKFVNGFAVTAGPQITSANPNSITPDATNPVTANIDLIGSGFVTGATTTFSGAGITVNSTNVVDATHATVNITVAPGTAHGPRTITVTNPSNGGSASCSGCFSIGPEPTVASVSPNTGGQGATFPAAGPNANPIVIKGTNLSGSSQVTFTPGSSSVTNNGMTVNSVSSPDASTLIVDLSIASNATPGPRDLQITNPAPSGGVSIPGAFTVTKAPTVTGSSPSTLGQGATNKDVTINGSDFNLSPKAVSVSFGPGVTINTTPPIIPIDSTHIKVNVSVDPAAATGARTIFVTNQDGGSGACNNCFTITGKPAVNTVTPSSKAQGTTGPITIAGTGFAQGATVGVSGTGVTVSATTVNANGTSITGTVTVTSTAALGARDVTVTNPDGGSGSKVGGFTVTAGPQVTGATPSSLNRGDATKTVTILGSGFQNGAAVTFNPNTGLSPNPPVTTFVDANHLTVVVTVAADAPETQRDIVVTNPDAGVGTCTKCFSVGPAPTVSKVTPSALGQGVQANLTVKGTNFVNGAAVTFTPSTGIVVNSTTFGDESTLVANVTIQGNAPAGAKTVTVTNPAGAHAGAASCSNCFTVDPAPTVTGSAPPSLARGATDQNVTINGTGFQNGAVASFPGGTGGPVVSSTTFVSSTQLTAKVSIDGAASTGTRNIVVGNPDGGQGSCNNCFNVT